MEHIFCTKDELVIADLVRLILPSLTIEPNDKMPQNICLECLGTVNNACELRERSIESEDYLNKLVSELFDDEVEKDLNSLVESSTPEEVAEVEDGTTKSISEYEDESSTCHPRPSDPNKSKRLNSKDAVLCFLCDLVLSRKSLARHMKIIHKQQNFKKKDHDVKKFKIDFKKKAEMFLNSPFKTSSWEAPRRVRTCKWCELRFEKNLLLTKHMKEVHTELYLEELEEKAHRPIGCSFCIERFGTVRSMKIHVKKEHDVDPELLLYYCDSCSFSTNDKSSIEVHLKEEHLGISGKDFHCVLCDSRFVNQKNLRNHLLLRHRIAHSNVYHCDDCDFHSHRKSWFEVVLQLFKCSKNFFFFFRPFSAAHESRPPEDRLRLSLRLVRHRQRVELREIFAPLRAL